MSMCTQTYSIQQDLLTLPLGQVINSFLFYICGVRDTPHTTPDSINSYDSCAADYKSGWWYNSCHQININRQPPNATADTLLFNEMKICSRIASSNS